MNINIAAASLAAILILIFGWITYKYEDNPNIPDISKFPFNQPTGKERSFVNKTGDSSLWIEGSRRRVIAQTYKPDWCHGAKTIKETQHTTGSTSGVVEAYFISGFGRCCPEVCCPEIVYNGNVDNGCDDACDEVIYDGNCGDKGCDNACDEVIYDGNCGDKGCDNACDEVIYDGNCGDKGCDNACEEVIYDGNCGDKGCDNACEEVIYDGSGDKCILSGEGTEVLG